MHCGMPARAQSESQFARRFSMRLWMAALAGWLALPCAFGQGDLLLRETFSREVSVFVGGVQSPPVREIASREVSVFIGGEPEALYREVVSREVSVFIGAEPESPYRQVVSREVSVLQPQGASYIVSGGERLAQRMLQSYLAPAADNSTTWLAAIGAGSVLSLPNVTNIIGNRWRSRGVYRVCSREVDHLTARGLAFQGGGGTGA